MYNTMQDKLPGSNAVPEDIVIVSAIDQATFDPPAIGT